MTVKFKVQQQVIVSDSDSFDASGMLGRSFVNSPASLTLPS